MKLLLVSVKSNISYGGIATWTEGFLQACAERELLCTLVNTELQGKRATQLGARRNLWDELARTVRIFRQLRAALKEKPTVAYLNTSCGPFGLLRDLWIANAIRRAGVKLITHYHCDIPYLVRSRTQLKWLEKLAKQSHRNLVLCETSKRYLREKCGTEGVSVFNFVEEIRPGEPKKVRPQVQTVLYVGRVAAAKGSPELYETALRCPGIRFLLVGEVCPNMGRLPVPENVELLGAMPHDRVMELLDQADVFLFPSHSEGCSVALIEAAAGGLPMIATDVGANRETVGQAGVIVPVGDVEAMVQALERLQDPTLRQEMSCAAIANVRENFSTTQLDKIFRLCREMAE